MQREAVRLKRRVFCHASSKGDERFFRSEIHAWLVTPPNKKSTWNQLLFTLVHKRNNDGRTLKYCYFNDRLQRVFLDRHFEKWALMARDEICNTLKQAYAG